MHQQAKNFLLYVKATFPQYMRNARVLDVGSGDILMTAQVMVPDEWRENMPNLACTAVDYLMPEPLAVGESWGRMNEP